MVAPQILALLVGVRVLPGKLTGPLRLSARTEDSQSSERGSIPLGTTLPQTAGPEPAVIFFLGSGIWDLGSGIWDLWRPGNCVLCEPPRSQEPLQ